MKKNKLNIISIILAPFKYFCLGCYYTLFILMYPFILLYNFVANKFYKAYSHKKTQTAKKEVIQAANMGMSSIDDKMQ